MQCTVAKNRLPSSPRTKATGAVSVEVHGLTWLLLCLGVAISMSSWLVSSRLQVAPNNVPAPRNPPSLDCSHGSTRSIASLPPDLSFICQDPAVSKLVIVASPPDPPPRILCVVLTHAENHATRLDAILETWGRKCHHFIAASDSEDESRYAYRVQAQEGYWGIWDKLMQTLRMILDKNIEFDWILKADDDTYVIMENLHMFLANVTREEMKSQPLIFGRIMPWPKLGELGESFGWFISPEQKAFRDRFFAKFPNKKERLRYAHGGPGYVMNRNYVKILVDAYFHSIDVIHGRISEDLANAFTMLYRNITPHSTIDVSSGKERSHPESPWTMYANPKWLPWIQEAIQNRGEGSDCCSPTSISYHHVNHREMKLLEYQIYYCPTPEKLFP